VSDVVRLDRRTHLWLWHADRGDWQDCGSGTPEEMVTAVYAANAAAVALGLNVTYTAAPRKPARLHPARVATVLLPAPMSERRYSEDFDIWQSTDTRSPRSEVPAWRIERDDTGDLVATPPPGDVIDTNRARRQWRDFALAVLAATHDTPCGVDGAA
jgi:hypothetical protein